MSSTKCRFSITNKSKNSSPSFTSKIRPQSCISQEWSSCSFSSWRIRWRILSKRLRNHIQPSDGLPTNSFIDVMRELRGDLVIVKQSQVHFQRWVFAKSRLQSGWRSHVLYKRALLWNRVFAMWATFILFGAVHLICAWLFPFTSIFGFRNLVDITFNFSRTSNVIRVFFQLNVCFVCSSFLQV